MCNKKLKLETELEGTVSQEARILTQMANLRLVDFHQQYFPRVQNPDQPSSATKRTLHVYEQMLSLRFRASLSPSFVVVELVLGPDYRSAEMTLLDQTSSHLILGLNRQLTFNIYCYKLCLSDFNSESCGSDRRFSMVNSKRQFLG